jgi:ribonucleoside-diphosphate reductase alpha chain
LQSNVLSLSTGSEIAVAALQVIRRNGAVVAFDADKIAVALTKAFLAVEGSQSAVSSRVRDVVAHLTQAVVRSLTRRMPDGGTVHIEDIQDQVELALMRSVSTTWRGPTCSTANGGPASVRSPSRWPARR